MGQTQNIQQCCAELPFKSQILNAPAATDIKTEIQLQLAKKICIESTSDYNFMFQS